MMGVMLAVILDTIIESAWIVVDIVFDTFPQEKVELGQIW
jgi:hypothetical protein